MKPENEKHPVKMTATEHKAEMETALLPEMERQLTDKHHYDLRKQYLQACEATACITLNGQGIRRFFADNQSFTDNIQLFAAWMLAHHDAEPEDVQFIEGGISVYGWLAMKVYADLMLVAETSNQRESIAIALSPILDDGSIADFVNLSRRA